MIARAVKTSSGPVWKGLSASTATLSAAVCVPLGNYHNMNQDTGKIGPEYVDLRDWRHMVTLLIDVARHAHTFTGEHTDLRKQLLQRLETFRPLLNSR